jgi:hypothetical protein
MELENITSLLFWILVVITIVPINFNNRISSFVMELTTFNVAIISFNKHDITNFYNNTNKGVKNK